MHSTNTLLNPLTTARDPAIVCAAGRKRAKTSNNAPSRQPTCKQST